jgi:outer membrane receptor for monomeric catechols
MLNVEGRGVEAESSEVNANGQESLTLNFVLTIKTQRQSMTVTDRLDRQSDYSPSATDQATLKTDTPLLLTPQSVQTVPTAVLLEQNACFCRTQRET